MDMTVAEWFQTRSFRSADFSWLANPGWKPALSTTLIFPTRNVADTIGPILETVARLRERTELISQVMLVDADSADGTADIGRAHGAEVYSENELMPQYGPTLGKGDAMWRSLSVARGDIVMFADSDTSDFTEDFVYGTLGPLLTLPEVLFTKAAYRRPYRQQEKSVVDGGGRVTELMAKPLLNAFRPELAGFVQPLAGEFAARRDLFTAIPFLTGYGVELGMMIDIVAEVGLPAMAQVDLGSRQNRHQSLFDLTLMASAVLGAMTRRLPGAAELAAAARPSWVRDLGQPDAYLHAVATDTGLRLDEHLNDLVERPPMAEVLSSLDRLFLGGEEEPSVA